MQKDYSELFLQKKSDNNGLSTRRLSFQRPAQYSDSLRLTNDVKTTYYVIFQSNATAQTVTKQGYLKQFPASCMELYMHETSTVLQADTWNP